VPISTWTDSRLRTRRIVRPSAARSTSSTTVSSPSAGRWPRHLARFLVMLGEERSLLARHYVDRPLVATLGNQAYDTIKEATRALSGLADARAGSPGPLGDVVALFLQFGGRLVQTRPRSAVRPSGPFRRKLAHPGSTSANWRLVRARSKPRRRRASITPAIPSLALPVSWIFRALGIMPTRGQEPAGTAGSKM